jgi:hypothetical protein
MTQRECLKALFHYGNYDYREIERLKPMVEPDGYLPCPDHRLPLCGGVAFLSAEYPSCTGMALFFGAI